MIEISDRNAGSSQNIGSFHFEYMANETAETTVTGFAGYVTIILRLEASTLVGTAVFDQFHPLQDPSTAPVGLETSASDLSQEREH